MKEEQIRINDSITAPEVRVVHQDESVVMPIARALEKADAAGLDLIEISPNASPPVCRIVDYNKFYYERNKKLKEARKNQKTVEVKEIKLSATIDDHDFSYRVKHIQEFLAKDDKVRIVLRFRGRQMAHTERGFQVIQTLLDKLDEASIPYMIDKEAKLEGRAINLFLSPRKKA